MLSLYVPLLLYLTLHRSAFCQFPFRWIYYCNSSESTRKETGKTHLVQMGPWGFWLILISRVEHKNWDFLGNHKTCYVHTRITSRWRHCKENSNWSIIFFLFFLFYTPRPGICVKYFRHISSPSVILKIGMQ